MAMKAEMIAACGMNRGISSCYLAGIHEIRSKGVNMAYINRISPPARFR
jgi:hypothetical protein